MTQTEDLPRKLREQVEALEAERAKPIRTLIREGLKEHQTLDRLSLDFQMPLSNLHRLIRLLGGETETRRTTIVRFAGRQPGAAR
jgi:AraC-like DNA-binding protein